MRIVRLLIWVATIFFAAMLFRPLVTEIVRQLALQGQEPF